MNILMTTQPTSAMVESLTTIWERVLQVSPIGPEDNFFDLVISLSPEAQHHAVEMTRTMSCEVEFWNTLDPSMFEGSREQRLEIYRQVRDQLERHILKRFPLAPSWD